MPPGLVKAGVVGGVVVFRVQPLVGRLVLVRAVQLLAARARGDVEDAVGARDGLAVKGAVYGDVRA